MDNAVTLSRMSFAWVPVNATKSWSFLEFHDDRGESVTVECLGPRPDNRGDLAFTELFERIRGVSIPHEAGVAALLGLRRHSEAAAHSRAVSALCNAVTEYQSRYANSSLTEHLGGTPAGSQKLYANVNRYLRDMQNTGRAIDFGRAAERAAATGFDIVKTDPFHEIRPDVKPDDVLVAVAPALERIAAMRSAVGDHVQLLVDCHGSFNADSAIAIAPELERYGVTWFEDPVRYRDSVDDLSRVAERVNIPLAAGGDSYGARKFADIARAGAKYTMQDVMRCGGAGESVRAGAALAPKGARTSCHSPFGPLSNLTSAHVHAAIPHAYALEHALWEHPARASLIDPPEVVENGRRTFPGGAGTGAVINWDVFRQMGGVRWEP